MSRPRNPWVSFLGNFYTYLEASSGRVTSGGRHSCSALAVRSYQTAVAGSLGWNELWPQGNAAESPSRVNDMNVGAGSLTLVHGES